MKYQRAYTALLPYQVLAQTAKELQTQHRAETALIRPFDIGAPAPPSVIIKLRALEIAGNSLLVGALARNWNARDESSYLFACPYKWKKLFTSNYERPRIFPPTRNLDTFLRLFSQEYALLEVREGNISTPAKNSFYARRAQEIDEFRQLSEQTMQLIAAQTMHQGPPRTYKPTLPVELAQSIDSLLQVVGHIAV